MTKRSVKHATFVIERTYDATPARVFAAWSNPKAKVRWFAGPEAWDKSELELDFRVGGRESLRGGPNGGPIHSYEARYMDIVPDQRIVYAYDMHLGDARISASLTTVEFAPAASGMRLTYTEQGVYLDGYDDAGERERGTRDLLDGLGASLQKTAD